MGMDYSSSLSNTPVVPTLLKGQSMPVMYTQRGRQRITIGLSWDTPEAFTAGPDAFVPETDLGVSVYGEQLDVEIGFVQETYDLDLVCLMFDKDKNLVDAVSPNPLESIDHSGTVYHSGDETQGISSGDDEQISIELAHLPKNVYSLSFIAIIQSGHYFGHVLNTECRLADGRTNAELWRAPLGRSLKEGSDKTAVHFCVIHKGGDTGWVLKNIMEYRIDIDVEDWAKEVTPYLPD